jgi:hypothetical protein
MSIYHQVRNWVTPINKVGEVLRGVLWGRWEHLVHNVTHVGIAATKKKCTHMAYHVALPHLGQELQTFYCIFPKSSTVIPPASTSFANKSMTVVLPM